MTSKIKHNGSELEVILFDVSQLREGPAAILQQPHISGDIPRPAPVARAAATPADILPDIEVCRTNKLECLVTHICKFPLNIRFQILMY